MDQYPKLTARQRGGLDDLDPDKPLPRPIDKAKRKAGEARAKALAREHRMMHRVILDLANLAMLQPRRPFPAAIEARIARLAESHSAVTAIMSRHKLPHVSSPPIVVVPLVILANQMARLLHRLVRPPHKKDEAFVGATYASEELIERWLLVGVNPRFLSRPRDRNAWIDNTAVAGAWIENLRHVPTATLSLVRACRNPGCRSPFFLRRSGQFEPHFHSAACRRAVTGD